ncbi:methyltransferase domain-containing protein [uncultured Roseivirga sp.]|uniref:SAM-dependent methyltransferase n=1 Tax=uncultured Roseivirga sp. TaxID=543088 RepID=UPI000D7B445A|nr:methyltransferase domain-containing protein [uncultured Roseivirga sp.]PWL27530.1 MAG: SAM-dependent methyltransferase [Roseivirga sp. XM-24bin3]
MTEHTPYRDPFVKTPEELLDKKLELAQITQDDLIIDLGCGDGYVMIAACQRYGCRAIGYEIDSEIVEMATKAVEESGLSDKIEIRQKDFSEHDFSEGTVYLLYLTRNELNKFSLPLEIHAPKGTRIVTHDFDMPAWEPKETVEFPLMSGDTKFIYLFEK